MVYVTGDLHGDLSRLSGSAVRRLKKGDTLIVCGDFGFLWNGGAAEQKLLRRLGSRRYTLAFLDGRHENFDLLGAYPVAEWNGGRVHQLGNRLVHLMRGEIYTLEGETYFTFGGGESDDREFREPGVSWWAEECPTEEEMCYALDNLSRHGNTVDYVLTHIPSGRCRLRLHCGAEDGLGLFLNHLEDTVTCKRWYFGSLHIDKAVSQQRRAIFREIIPISSENTAASR